MSSAVGQGGAGSLSGAACVRPSVLDESLIREQTKVDHFWGELAAVGVSGCLGEGEVPGQVVPLPRTGWEELLEDSRRSSRLKYRMRAAASLCRFCWPRSRGIVCCDVEAEAVW